MSKKKILFSVISEKGHINPMIGVAQYLQKDGYELAFFCQNDISETLLNAGLISKNYFSPSTENYNNNFITKGKLFVEGIKKKDWLINWIKTLLIDFAPAQIELIKSAVEDFQPSIIVTDPMIYAAAIVADEFSIPWVGLSSSLNPVTPPEWRCDLIDTLEKLHHLRMDLFKNSKINPVFKVSDLISPWLNFVFTTEDYVPRKFCGNNFSFYLGKSFSSFHRGDETDFPFEKLKPHTKKVYMSLGSQIYYHPELFLTISEVFLDDNIQLIISINELINTSFINKLPENVIPVFYAPQLQLLKHVDLAITHGGANSVIESLAHGIPIALFPICNDQFLQSRFMENAGVGISLDPSLLCIDSYKKQLLPLLEENSLIRKKAQKIGKSFENYGGALEASQLIQQLNENQKAILPHL